MPSDRWWEWLDSTSLLDLAAVLFGVGLILGGIAVWWKKVRPWLVMVRVFFTDWFGVEDRPGVPGRKGVMPQLEAHGAELVKQSAQLEDHSDRLKRIETKAAEAVYNGKANSGHSPYDELRDEMRAGFAAINQVLNASKEN